MILEIIHAITEYLGDVLPNEIPIQVPADVFVKIRTQLQAESTDLNDNIYKKDHSEILSIISNGKTIHIKSK